MLISHPHWSITHLLQIARERKGLRHSAALHAYITLQRYLVQALPEIHSNNFNNFMSLFRSMQTSPLGRTESHSAEENAKVMLANGSPLFLRQLKTGCLQWDALSLQNGRGIHLRWKGKFFNQQVFSRWK